MPYTEKQVDTFRAIEHGWKPRKGSLAKLSPKKAGEMADEGVKHEVVSRGVKRMRG